MANKIIFPTPFTVHERERIYSEPGRRIHEVYSMEVDEDGKKRLVVVGTENHYEMIQAHKDSCDIETIIKRYQNGDLDALNMRHATYMDITGMPTSYAEMFQLVQDAENNFNRLPLQIREQFNFSPSEFFAAAGTEKFSKVYADYFDSLRPTETHPEVAPEVEPVKEGDK